MDSDGGAKAAGMRLGGRPPAGGSQKGPVLFDLVILGPPAATVFPAYKEGVQACGFVRSSRLATDERCHLPPRADLMPRPFSSVAMDAYVTGAAQRSARPFREVRCRPRALNRSASSILLRKSARSVILR